VTCALVGLGRGGKIAFAVAGGLALPIIARIIASPASSRDD
jgi:hypothetical protein